MDRHTLNTARFHWPAFCIYAHFLEQGHRCVHSFQDFTEHCILAVQMRSCCVANEELASIGSRSFIRHAQNASRIVSEGRSDFVFEQGSINRCAWEVFGRFARCRWRNWDCAALYHKVLSGRMISISSTTYRRERTTYWNIAVKGRAIILV